VAAVPPVTPVVQDACGNNVAPVLISTVNNPNPLTCEGTRTYTYSYTDCAGNTTNWIYTYTIDISNSPIVPANGSLTVACLAEAIAPVTPAVVDACGNNLTAVLVNIVNNPNPIVCAGTRTYNYSFSDCSGNISNWSYVYTISAPIIVVTCPPDQSFNANPGDNYSIPVLVATDNCSGGFIINWTITGATSRNGVGNNASGLFNVGISDIAWTVTDQCGNVHNCNTQVEILMPVVTCPNPIVVCRDAGLQLLSGTGESPAGGVFSGAGVSLNAGLYYFNPAIGVGPHVITYVWTNPSGYSGTCTFNATVNSLPTFTATIAQQPLCFGNSDGIISLAFSAGTLDFDIDWGSGNATSSLMNYSINALAAGNYNIVVNDANGCSYQNSVTLINPPVLTASSSATEIMCNGETSEINVTAVGGTPGYSGTGLFTVTAGTYSYTVTDSHGCTANTSIIVVQPDLLNATIVVNSNVTCNGLSNGNATATATGGTPLYDFLWNDAPTFTNSRYATQLRAGTWTVVVTDANGCIANRSITITEPDVLTVTLTAGDVSCFNGEDGYAAVDNISGGTTPYFYHWNTEAFSATINDLAAGNYQLTLSDFYDCEAYANITVNEPPLMQIFLTSSPAQCGNTGGSAFASIMGGTNPYDFDWSNGASGNNITNVIPNNYTVTVTDDNGCIGIESTTVSAIGFINASISQIQTISCPGYENGILQASSSNGQNPLEYSWNTGATSSILSNVGFGSYVVIITDSWGCTGSSTSVLVNPQSMVLNPTIEDVNCFGGNDGSIILNTTGGTAPYYFVWSNSMSNSTIINLTAGDYTITVTDQGNCTVSQVFTVNQPDELVLLSTINNISCYGNTDGAVLMSATGGIVPYSFQISDGTTFANGASHVGLALGAYTLSLVDNHGCSKTENIIIQEPGQLAASFISHDPSCIGNNDGFIEIQTTGGTEPYSFGWNENMFGLPYISGLIQGNYDVTVIDANNCTLDLGTIILNDVEVDCLTIPNAFTPNADGINDTWIIDNLELFPGAYVYVYNRWGQQLYLGTPSDNPWDGRYNGKFVPAGPYLYVINLYDGSRSYTGIVTVVY
jgi:gliding motility-associated-like protein